MIRTASSPTLELIRRVAADPRMRCCADEELLGRFVEHHDEAAFETLVRRHGPMILDVCRGALPNEADVDDAFQATFLVLAQKASSIRNAVSLASWLHGVAYRTACKARTEFARRRKHEAGVSAAATKEAADELAWCEVRHVVHQELNALSGRYRAPLLLCYLEGKTQDEAAGLLGLAKSTFKDRLERGRTLLRARLVHRGLGPAALLIVSAWPAAGLSACVPTSLVLSTVKAAKSIAAGQTLVAGVASAAVAALTQGVLNAMLLTKLKIATALLLVAAVAAAGAGLVGLPAGAADPPRPPKAEKLSTRAEDKPQPALKPVVVKDDGQLLRVAWSPDGKTVTTLGCALEVVEDKDTGGRGGVVSHTIKRWDAKTGKLDRSLGKEKAKLVRAVAFSRDRQTAAIALSGNLLQAIPVGEATLMDTKTWEVKHTFTFDDVDVAVAALALSPDGKTLAVGGHPNNDAAARDGNELPSCLTLWDVEKKKAIEWKPMTGERALDGIHHLAFSPDGKLLAIAEDGRVRIFNVQTGEAKAVLDTQGAPLLEFVFSPDGKTLVTGDQDKTAKLWDLQERKLRRTLKARRGTIWTVAFSPDGKLLATGGFEQAKNKWQYEVILWDAKTGEQRQTLATNLAVPVLSLAFSPDGKTLAAAGGLLGNLKDGAKPSGGELTFFRLNAIAAPAPKDRMEPEGTWTVVASEQDASLGQFPKDTVWTFADGKLTVGPKKGRDGMAFTYAVTFDPAKDPKEVDLVEEVGDRKVVLRGIYRLEKDRLTICVGAAVGDAKVTKGERPTEFKAGENVQLVTLEWSGK